MTQTEDTAGEHTELSVWIRIARSPWPKLAMFAVLLGVLGWFALTHGTTTVDTLRDWTAQMGIIGALILVLIYALATLTLLPATLLTAPAGVLYGPVVGVLVVWSGAMLGAAGSFLLGRVLSRAAVEQLAGGRGDRLNTFLAARGTFAVLLMRLTPLPRALVNYGSAATVITLRQYLIGTALGILPGITAHAALGGSITDPGSPVFIISVAALVLLAVGGGVVARRHDACREPPGEGER